jgi:hypothetical protein
MRSKNKGFRLDLGDELDAKLRAFCAVHYDADMTKVIRKAVEEHIDATLADASQRRKDYELILAKQGIAPPLIRLVPRARKGR